MRANRTAAPRPRLVVADDHAMYREGILRALARQDTFDVVAVCADGLEALAAVLELRPDVALLDVSMPGLSGTRVVSHVRDLPGPPCDAFVLLSAEEDIEELAWRHGATLGLGKHLPRAQIVAAVAAVATHASFARQPASPRLAA